MNLQSTEIARSSNLLTPDSGSEIQAKIISISANLLASVPSTDKKAFSIQCKSIPLKWEILYCEQQWYETMVHTFLGGDQADYEDCKEKIY